MKLLKSFHYHDKTQVESDSLEVFQSYYDDSVEVSITRSELIALYICLSRLVRLEGEFRFYRDDACSFLDKLDSIGSI